MNDVTRYIYLLCNSKTKLHLLTISRITRTVDMPKYDVEMCKLASLDSLIYE